MHDSEQVESACNQDNGGARVRVWTGKVGVTAYRTLDGWVGVMLDGEGGRVDEWQAWQVEPMHPSASRENIQGGP